MLIIVNSSDCSRYELFPQINHWLHCTITLHACVRLIFFISSNWSGSPLADADLHSRDGRRERRIVFFLLRLRLFRAEFDPPTSRHPWRSSGWTKNGRGNGLAAFLNTGGIIWKRWFFGRFSAFYGQRSVTAAWATRSPWSIIKAFVPHFSF